MLGFTRGARLSEGLKLACAAVKESIDGLPSDFTVNTRRYGNLSGSSAEERLVRAFNNGSLPLREGVSFCKVCTACGGKHVASYCPQAPCCL